MCSDIFSAMLYESNPFFYNFILFFLKVGMACFWAKVIQVSVKGNIGGISAEDEQKPKLRFHYKKNPHTGDKESLDQCG